MIKYIVSFSIMIILVIIFCSVGYLISSLPDTGSCVPYLLRIIRISSRVH